MKHKIFKVITLMLGLGFILSAPLFSQNKVHGPALQNYYSLCPTGDASIPMLTTVQPPAKVVPAHEKDLLQRLETARRNNDVAAKEQAERELDAIHGSITVPLTSGQNGLPAGVNTFIQHNDPPFHPDYQTVPVNTGSNPWSVTTCTNPVGFPNAGRIWCVYTGFSSSVTDTLKTAYSDNNGVTWVQYASFNYGSANAKFRSSELKCVPVYDGTNMYLFIVGAVDYLGNQYSELFRYNVTATTYFGADILYPGHIYSYNARVCTDNADYPTGEYVMILSSQDSVTSGGNSDTRQKYAVLLTPGAVSPTITYRGPGPAGGAFYYHTSVVTGTYLSSDIGYYKDYGGTSANRIMTVWNVNLSTNPVLNNLYLAWSDDYGLTNAGAINLTSTTVTRGARIAFNSGGTSGTPNRNGMITYYKLFSGSDWDYVSFNTTTGGTTIGAWTSVDIDFSSNHASGHPDVIAEWGANNIFKAAYTEDISGPKGMYSGFNGTAWTAPAYLDVTGNGVDTTYTGINPGYKNGGGDDNIAFYSKVGGTGDQGIYCANNISSTVGINPVNNEIPKAFSLMQNYPNPFNPTTNIKFSIPQSGFVKLVIFDVAGKQIATLVDGQLNAGNYAYNFDASKIASGVYFYKLETNGFTDVKKMMLIK